MFEVEFDWYVDLSPIFPFLTGPNPATPLEQAPKAKVRCGRKSK